MKVYFKCTLFLLLFPFLGVAQSNYKPGYVVTLKGDTMRGFIDYKEWDNNPVSINFKSGGNDVKPAILTTNEISFFNISQLEAYQKYTGDITMDVTDPNRISNGRDSSFKTTSVFLKILQKGSRLTLYSYADDIKTRFFIKDNAEGQIKELIYRVYYDAGRTKTSNQSGGTVNENTYLKQLFALAQKYDVLTDSYQADLEHSFYSSLDISKLVSKINGISKADYNKKLSAETPVQFFVGAALNITKTAPGGFYKAAGGTGYTSYLPEISFGINIFANPNTQKLVFRVELMLGDSKVNANYINKNLPYIPITYSYNQYSAALTPQIIYNFYNAANFKIYGGVGVPFTFYKFSGENFGNADGKTPIGEIVQDNPFAFNTFGTPVVFKVGVMFSHNWSIYGDYITSSTISPDGYFANSFSSIQAGVTYTFR